MFKKIFYSLIILSFLSSYVIAMQDPAENTSVNQNITTEISTAFKVIRDIKQNADGSKTTVLEEDSNFVEVYDAVTQDLICELRGHDAPILCTIFHPEKDIIFTGSVDAKIKIWDASSGACLSIVPHKLSNAPITSLAFSKDFSLLLSGNNKGCSTIRLFTSSNYKQMYLVDQLTCEDFNESAVYYTSFNHSGTLAFVATEDGTLKIYARPENFQLKQCEKKWPCRLRYYLARDKVESIFNKDDYIFIQLKSSHTMQKKFVICKITNDAPSIVHNVGDYCSLMNKYLTIKEGQLFEHSLDLNQSSGQLIWQNDTELVSAVYNSTGNKITITAKNDESTILENILNHWVSHDCNWMYEDINLVPQFGMSVAQSENDNLELMDIKIEDETSDTELEGTSTEVDEDESMNLQHSQDEDEVFSFVDDNNREQASSVQYNSKNVADEESEFVMEEEEFQPCLTANISNNTSPCEDELNTFQITPILGSSIAIENKHQNAIQKLVALNNLISFDRDIFKKPLIEIIANHPEDIIEQYIAQFNGNFNDRDNKGRTALYAATATNKEATVRLLTKYGADVNISDSHGFSPLHVSLSKNYILITGCLLAHNALVNSKASSGITPLHIAVKNKDLPSIKLLLKANANMFAEDNQSNTPLGLVNEAKDPSLIELFIEKLKIDNPSLN